VTSNASSLSSGIDTDKIPEDENIDVLAGMDAPLQWLIGMGVGTVKQGGAVMLRGESTTTRSNTTSRETLREILVQHQSGRTIGKLV
jgi:hypothetical protein